MGKVSIKRNSIKVDMLALQLPAADSEAASEPNNTATEADADLDLGDLDAQLEELEGEDGGAVAKQPIGATEEEPAMGNERADDEVAEAMATDDSAVEEPAAPQEEAAAVQDEAEPADDHALAAPAQLGAPAPVAKPIVKRKGLSVAKAAPSKADEEKPDTSANKAGIDKNTANKTAKNDKPNKSVVATKASATDPAEPKEAPAYVKPDKPKKPAVLKKASISNPDASKTTKAMATSDPKAEKPDKGDKRPRAQSAYNFFTADKRSELKAAEPGLSMGEMSKRMGEMWKAMSDADKNPYEAKAAADKASVKAQQDRWDADHPKEPAAKKQKVSAKAQAEPKTTAAKSLKSKSAFAVFAASRRKELREEVPDASMTEISDMVEQEWRNMDQEEKAAFEPRTEAAAHLRDGDEVMHGAGVEHNTADEESDHADDEGSDGKAPVRTKKTHKAAARSSKRGKKRGRAVAKDSGVSQEDEGGQDDEAKAENAENEEDYRITSEPDFILCQDSRNRYLVKLKDSVNMYDFKFVDANKVKQLRNGGDPAEGENAFNGHGLRLLELVEEYDRYIRAFDMDARECMDSHGILNFDLMRSGSNMDMCATLGTMHDPDVGGLLSRKPKKSKGAVRGVEDKIIHVPAMMLSLVVQRMVNYWMGRALCAEAQLCGKGKGQKLAETQPEA